MAWCVAGRLVGLVLLLISAPAANAQVPAPLVVPVGKPVDGELTSPGLTHAWVFEALAGTRLSVKAAGTKTGLLPALSIRSLVTGKDLGLADFVKASGGSRFTLRGLVLPEDGRYQLTLSGLQGSTGVYRVRWKQKLPKTAGKLSADSAPGLFGEAHVLRFSALAGSKLRGKILSQYEGVDLAGVTLEGPDGPVSLEGQLELRNKGRRLLLKPLVLPAFGSYELRIGGDLSFFDVKAKLRLRPAKLVKKPGVQVDGADPWVVDSDGDGFVDGFEWGVGSSADVADEVATIVGRVELASGVAPGSASVWVEGVRRDLVASVSDVDGSFELGPWPASAAHVVVRAGYLQAPLHNGSSPGRSQPVDITGGGAWDAGVLTIGGPLLPRLSAEHPGVSAHAGALVGDLDADGAQDLVLGPCEPFTICTWLGTGTGGLTRGDDLPFVATAPDLGDVDGDGDLDIVAGQSSRLRVFAGDGTGAFPDPADSLTGALIRSVQLADLDVDGDLDAVLVDPDGGARWWRGQGTGEFVPATDLLLGAPLEHLVVRDLDADGRPDLVASRVDAASVELHRGTGNANFAAPTILPTDAPLQQIVAARVDADERLDLGLLTAADEGGSRLTTRLAGADGSYANSVITEFAANVLSLTAADLGGDALGDVLALIEIPPVIKTQAPTQRLSVLTGDGSGAFAATAEQRVVDPHLAVVADVDGTGSADVLVVSAHLVTLFAGTPSGALREGTLLPGASEGRLHIADVQGDGHADVLLAPLGQGPIVVWQGDGNGNFPVRIETSLPFSPSGVALGAIDDDDQLDAVLTLGASGASLLGVGTPTPAIVDIALPQAVSDVTLVDIDGDGELDLLAVGRTPTGPWMVHVLAGAGNGSFSTVTSLAVSAAGAPSGQPAVAASDLDADGHRDVLVGVPGVGLQVLLGDGQGGLGAPTLYPAGAASGDLFLGDINGDAILDALVSNLAQSVVLDGNGAGGFGEPRDFPKGMLAMEVADLNADGTLDLLTPGAPGTLAVRLGTAGGAFLPPQTFFTGSASPRAGDLDGDGKLDLVLLTFEDSEFVARAHRQP